MEEKNKTLLFIIISIMVGLFAGAVATTYRHIVFLIEKFLIFSTNLIEKNPLFIILMAVLISTFAIIANILKEIEPLASGSGIPQVNAEIDEKIKQNPLKILFAKIVGGSLAALSGLSVGREGPSIQMGAMAGKIISSYSTTFSKEDREIFLKAGACSGLAAAFNAPIAAIMFALEELHGKYDKKLFVCIMASVLSSDFFSKITYSKTPVFNFALENTLDFKDYYYILLFAILVVILSAIYIYLMKFFMEFNKSLKVPRLYKMTPYFLISLPLFASAPYLLGGGGFLIEKLVAKEFTISALVIILIIKLFFSISSFSSGVAGGIFFPILVMGATLGQIFALAIKSDKIEFFMVIGMAALLTGIVRSPLTSVLLLYEMTGNITTLLPLGIACFTVYIIMNYFNVTPIYTYLYSRLVNK